jgi:hypothetical protein
VGRVDARAEPRPFTATIGRVVADTGDATPCSSESLSLSLMSAAGGGGAASRALGMALARRDEEGNRGSGRFDNGGGTIPLPVSPTPANPNGAIVGS